jgi:biopolymer transport protein ExbD
MRFFKSGRGGHAEADWTPMIDMTFNLIAFFMLIMNFSTDQHVRIQLPDSELVKPPDGPPKFDIVLTLNQNASVQMSQFDEVVSNIELMAPFLKREISNAAAQDVPIDEIDVVIRAHRDTATGLVQDLIAKCQEVNLQKFKLRVKERTE